jgi:preprotein translocase subunit SecD
VKKKLKWKIILIIIVTLVALVYLFPSLPGYEYAPEWYRKYMPKDTINLGLDLQGGMHLVLEVDVDKAIDNALERTLGNLRRSLEKEGIMVERLVREGDGKLALRLVRSEQTEIAAKVITDFGTLQTLRGIGGEFLLAFRENYGQQVKENAVSQGLETLRNRIDQFGVAEPLVVREGDQRIIIQLPGVKDPQRALNLIGKTALLEFKLVDTARSLEEALKGNVPEGGEIIYERVTDKEGNVSKRPYLLEKKTLFTGDVLTNAEVRISSQTGESYVSMEFDKEGARIFSDITTANVGRQMAIILDGNVYSAPVIREKIPDGRAQITGHFSTEEAKDLSIVLRAGALPAPVKILENTTVGPSLGQDSIHKGFTACLIGFFLVVIFMAVYYKLSGVVADFALILNLIILLGALAALRATLTLPGIAGVALTTGMAVDSNVLIFERIREEIRLGKTIRSSVDGGYDKAFLTIIDSHVTTLLTAAVLFLFGTGPVKGFAVALFLGVSINLFTALVGTKVVFDFITRRRDIKRWSV